MPVTFQDDAAAVVAEIRDLFAQVIETKCRPGSGLPEICEGFGIHRKLAWQLTKVAYGDDPFFAARYMPTPKGIETWIRSAAEHGIDRDLLDSVREASAKFEHLIETHAGNRTAMDMLLESCVAEPSEDIDTRWRQRAFEGNSYIWGVQARSMLSCSILAPSKDRRGWMDMAQARSLIDLRRTRPGTRWMIGQAVVFREGSAPDTPDREPLDAETARITGGVPVLGSFTTNPLPNLERRETGTGLLLDELLPGEIGQAGQLTITTGEVVRNLAPAYAIEDGDRALFSTGVSTPAEVLIYDHFVHKDLFGAVERELCVFGELGRPFTSDEQDRLRVPEQIQPMGSGLSNVHTPDVPGYAKLLRHAFSKCDWNPTDFALHRVRMAYPPLTTSVMIRHELPAAPDWLEP
ncbi:MAG: hypothetical protein NCW75_03770 [Phycisphaera sp.]|nr:MAG: hypothetical protein NCW75_03770 [Phycisphaera sp.]